jgi:hypothetical protein
VQRLPRLVPVPVHVTELPSIEGDRYVLATAPL